MDTQKIRVVTAMLDKHIDPLILSCMEAKRLMKEGNLNYIFLH